MIIILKIILGILALVNIFIGIFVWKDFFKVRKTDGFDNLSMWEKIKFNSVFCFMLMSLACLFAFFIFFIIVNLKIV